MRTFFEKSLWLALISSITLIGCSFSLPGEPKAASHAPQRNNYDGIALDSMNRAFSSEAVVPFDMCMLEDDYNRLATEAPRMVILRLKFKKGNSKEMRFAYMRPDLKDEHVAIDPKGRSKCAPAGKVKTDHLPHKAFPLPYQAATGEVQTIEYTLVPIGVYQRG